MMSKKEKRVHAHREKVFAFMVKEGISDLASATEDAEPYFSKRPCECCGDPAFGNREDMVGIPSDVDQEERHTYEVCVDCVYFFANGDLPDEESDYA